VLELSPANVSDPALEAVFWLPKVGVMVQEDALVLVASGIDPTAALVAFVPPWVIDKVADKSPAVPVMFPVVPDGRAKTPVELTVRLALPLDEPFKVICPPSASVIVPW